MRKDFHCKAIIDFVTDEYAFNKRFDRNMDLFQKLSKVRVCTTVRELNEQFPGDRLRSAGPHEGMTLKYSQRTSELLNDSKTNSQWCETIVGNAVSTEVTRMNL
ncbi:hypothetical protein HYFRA_00000683 [Hymenoscyphus fraxineus]|uniref:Uncharacterized protein n=1 Tax=Hymenoscyphus fraxineus TaxID=746836 RepID=A0A9N9PY49_9HELO|nr:hypothetical protein HYFRA_00000683 [Hymenoscyphus fraxineus]